MRDIAGCVRDYIEIISHAAQDLAAGCRSQRDVAETLYKFCNTVQTLLQHFKNTVKIMSYACVCMYILQQHLYNAAILR